MSWLITRPVAHRGLHGEGVPENSLLSFQKAIEKGHPIEFDIHLTKDQEIVVFHDSSTKRMCGRDVDVHESLLSELKKIKMSNSEEFIPSLEDVLSMVNGRVPLLIEVKTAGKAGVFEKRLGEMMESYNGEFAIQSFNPWTIRWLRKKYPKMSLGYLSGSLEDIKIHKVQRWILKNLYLFHFIGADFVGYDCQNIEDSAVKALRKQGVPILTWTVKSKDSYNKVKDHCDNIIFESFIPS